MKSPTEYLLANVLRRLLAKDYSIVGTQLTVHATVDDLTDDEFDAVWGALGPIDDSVIQAIGEAVRRRWP